MAKTFGLEVHAITPSDIKSKWPLLNTDDVIGGVFLPADGQTNPIDTTMALAKGARAGGAQIFENTEVTGLLSDGKKATGVKTAEGGNQGRDCGAGDRSLVTAAREEP